MGGISMAYDHFLREIHSWPRQACQLQNQMLNGGLSRTLEVGDRDQQTLGVSEAMTDPYGKK